MPSRYTKTSSFLIFAAGIDSPSHPLFQNAFLEDEGFERPDNITDDIYLVFNTPYAFDYEFKEMCEYYRDLPNLLQEYEAVDIERGEPCIKVIFRLQLLPKWKHIKEELKTSKYTKIDREYVNSFYREKVIIGKDNSGRRITEWCKNYKILTADISLVKELEEKLDITLPPDAEVLSKLNLDQEHFRRGYKEKINVKDTENCSRE